MSFERADMSGATIVMSLLPRANFNGAMLSGVFVQQTTFASATCAQRKQCIDHRPLASQ